MRTLVILALGSILAAVENSGGFRGPERNGVFPAEGLARSWPEDGPRLLWTHRGLGEGLSAVCVAGDTVYANGGVRMGHLTALDLDGRVRWREPYGPEFRGGRFEGPRCTPTVAGERVIVASGAKDKRDVYCFRARDGKLRWNVDGNARFGGASQGWGYNETPLVVDDKVIVTLRAKDATTPPVVALDLETGDTVWTADPEEGDLSAGDTSAIAVPYGDGATMIVDHLWRAILALDPASGERIWKIPVDRGSFATPFHHDGRLYLQLGHQASGQEPGLACYRIGEDGQLDREWFVAGMRIGLEHAVVADGKLFSYGPLPDAGKRGPKGLRAHDAATGVFVHAVAGSDGGALAAADGLVFWMQAAEKHWKTTTLDLVVPTAGGFEIAGSFTPEIGTKENWVHPVIADGRLYHRHGDLLAVYDIAATGE